MGSGLFTPSPQPLMMPSSRMRVSSGNAPVVAILNCSSQGVGSSLLSGERSWTKNCNRLLGRNSRSEEHTSELQSLTNLVCRLLLEKKKKKINNTNSHN